MGRRGQAGHGRQVRVLIGAARANVLVRLLLRDLGLDTFMRSPPCSAMAYLVSSRVACCARRSSIPTAIRASNLALSARRLPSRLSSRAALCSAKYACKALRQSRKDTASVDTRRVLGNRQ